MHLLALLLLVGGVPKGGKLFIKGSGVSMTANPDGTGAKTALRAGDEVTWRGADEKNKSAQAIEFRGKQGFVSTVSLTPNKPADEVTSAGKTVSAEVFASSGAAGCNFGEAGARFAGGSPETQATAKGLSLIEASSEQAKARVDEHVRQQGLR
jgi:hypothetical protein